MRIDWERVAMELAAEWRIVTDLCVGVDTNSESD